MGKQDDLFGGDHADAIISLNAGRGTGTCWNPEKILNCLRNLVRWQSARKLRTHQTRLYCEECRDMCSVSDYKPLASLAVLSCRHERPVSTMSAEGYSDLVALANELKIQVMRNPVLGGYSAVSQEG
jgi:hypothetical protein